MTVINRSDMVSALMDLMPKWGKTVIKHAHYKHDGLYKRKTNESLMFSRGKGPEYEYFW